MKYKIILVLITVHLLYIIVNSCGHTVSAYLDFYASLDSTHQDNKFNNALSKVENTINEMNRVKPILVYSKYTGAEMGYGFFAPNVLSSGGMSFKYKGKNLTPIFKTREGYVRFYTLISEFIGHIVNPQRHPGAKSTKEGEDLQSKYYDLVYKNVATKVYADYDCKEDMVASLYIYAFPDLELYNSNEKHAPIYFPIKSQKIFLK